MRLEAENDALFVIVETLRALDPSQAVRVLRLALESLSEEAGSSNATAPSEPLPEQGPQWDLPKPSGNTVMVRGVRVSRKAIEDVTTYVTEHFAKTARPINVFDVAGALGLLAPRARRYLDGAVQLSLLQATGEGPVQYRPLGA